ncbi:MAG: haloacid dehalogenase-like hydrolase [Clostridiaceae bacterium]|nr:haloacid dehalogenase-like hydrolase [Clostridiaceae bacterium]
MMKRFLNCFSSDFAQINKTELLAAIAQAEGRTVVSETIGVFPPLLTDVTNAELAASFGADMLILNLFDVDNPTIYGLPQELADPDFSKLSVINKVKYLTGRPVGINLEPTIAAESNDPNPFKMTAGRIASVENAKKALEQGVNFLVITGNPETGVDNQKIIKSLEEIKEAVGDQLVLIAGKMHGSGILSESAENIITEADVLNFMAAGADIILLPAPGTIPGITMDYIRKLVQIVHQKEKMTLTSIGTSQEGADPATIKQIALLCKMTGTDLHHIGDSGYIGIATPENIMHYGIVIRGVRHTYHRMAASIRR